MHGKLNNRLPKILNRGEKAEKPESTSPSNAHMTILNNPLVAEDDYSGAAVVGTPPDTPDRFYHSDGKHEDSDHDLMSLFQDADELLELQHTAEEVQELINHSSLLTIGSKGAESKDSEDDRSTYTHIRRIQSLDTEVERFPGIQLQMHLPTLNGLKCASSDSLGRSASRRLPAIRTSFMLDCSSSSSGTRRVSSPTDHSKTPSDILRQRYKSVSMSQEEFEHHFPSLSVSGRQSPLGEHFNAPSSSASVHSNASRRVNLPKLV